MIFSIERTPRACSARPNPLSFTVFLSSPVVKAHFHLPHCCQSHTPKGWDTRQGRYQGRYQDHTRRPRRRCSHPPVNLSNRAHRPHAGRRRSCSSPSTAGLDPLQCYCAGCSRRHWNRSCARQVCETVLATCRQCKQCTVGTARSMTRTHEPGKRDSAKRPGGLDTRPLLTATGSAFGTAPVFDFGGRLSHNNSQAFKLGNNHSRGRQRPIQQDGKVASDSGR
eukprot:COSAG05_NODE_380_length_10564_cov_116.331676_6_plen_223_part_00